MRDFLPISTQYYPSVSNALWFSAEDGFPKWPKNRQPFYDFCLYLLMNDLLFQKQKHIKDKLVWWFCFVFLINICYTKLEFSFKCLFLSQWMKNQAISLVLWKYTCCIFVMYTSMLFSVKSTINWNHSAFFVFDIKPNYNLVLWPWQQTECIVLTQSLCLYAVCKFLGNT